MSKYIKVPVEDLASIVHLAARARYEDVQAIFHYFANGIKDFEEVRNLYGHPIKTKVRKHCNNPKSKRYKEPHSDIDMRKLFKR